MQVLKMNALLAKVEHGASVFRKMTAEYLQFFTKGQTQFTGVRKTYQPREGTADDPSMRQNNHVVTTVTEKLDWYEKNAETYINSTLSVDATNASNTVKVPLIVNGVSLGELSVLELMKLKTLITKMGMEEMYSNIPVRSDTIIWHNTTDEAYERRDIVQTELLRGVKRTDSKVEIILEDPNIKLMIESGKVPDVSKYNPTRSVKSTMIEVGDYTLQHFSGEYTQRQKAEILQRRSKLLEAIEVAMKQANDTPVVESNLSASTLFNYLHRNILPTQTSL